MNKDLLFKQFLKPELLEEDDAADDADEGDDSDTDSDDDSEDDGEEFVPKSQHLKEKEALQKKNAKLAAQRNAARKEAKELKESKDRAPSQKPLDEETLDTMLSERERLNKLKEEYPDVDVEAVKKLKKEKGLTYDEAFKIVAFDEVKKQSPQMGLGGKADAQYKTQYTIKEVSKLPQDEYDKVMDLQKAGKVKVVAG